MLETCLLLGKSTIFGAFMKGGTPLDTLGEHYFLAFIKGGDNLAMLGENQGIRVVPHLP
jgi:hypothetical protein